MNFLIFLWGTFLVDKSEGFLSEFETSKNNSLTNFELIYSKLHSITNSCILFPAVVIIFFQF